MENIKTQKNRSTLYHKITKLRLNNKKARDGIRTRGPHLGKVVLHP